MADWTDETRKELIAQYLAKDPTPENSMEIVAELAPDFDTTPNGARAILSKAEVYVKKVATKSTSTASGEKKETKAESLSRLSTVLESQSIAVDATIIDKMTGKAAAYFADAFTTVIATEE